jgi:hypothetical protein
MCDVPYTIMDEPTQMVTHTPAKMLRCIKMCPGMVAVSGQNICTSTNATSNTLASTSSNTILHSPHAYVDPPH